MLESRLGSRIVLGVHHRLGGEGCYVGKGNEKKNFRRHHMYGR